MSLFNSVIIPLKNRVRKTPFLRRMATRFLVNAEFPSVLGIDPTNRCNLRCSFCGPNLMREKKGVMPWPLYESIIGQLSAHKPLWMLILHNFGEPLLNPDIGRMVSLARRRKVARSVQFATNGTLLTPDISRELIDAGLDGLVISVDAYSRDEYASLKGRDLLGAVIENTRAFMALKKKLGKTRPFVSAKMVARRGHEKSFAPFVKMWSTIADEAALTSYSNWGNMVADEGVPAAPHTRYACHFPWYYPAIAWDGRVYFCCAACDPESVIGDLRGETLDDIWRGEKLRRVRRAHLDGRFADIRSCARCTYWAESRVDCDRWLRKRERRATA